jgi:hypothetical protein
MHVRHTSIRMLCSALAVMGIALGIDAGRIAPADAAPLSREPGDAVGIEVQFPHDDEYDTVFPSWIWFAGARKAVTPRAAIVGELPWVGGDFEDRYSYVPEDPPPPPRGHTFGNPYLGVEVVPRWQNLHASVGARLPLASDRNSTPLNVAMQTAFDREEAFAPHEVSVRGGLRYERIARGRHGVGFAAGAAPVLRIRTRTSPFTNPHVLDACYDAAITLAETHAWYRAGLVGRHDGGTLEAGNGDTGARREIVLAYGEQRGRFAPAAQLTFPFDRTFGFHPQSALSLSLGYALGSGRGAAH